MILECLSKTTFNISHRDKGKIHILGRGSMDKNSFCTSSNPTFKKVKVGLDEEIMAISDSMKLVIIGCGAGGFAAALSAVKNDATCEVTILERRPYEMYSPCSMPYAIEGMLEIPSLKHGVTLARTKVMTGCEATLIDTEGKKILYRDNGKEKSVSYDALIIDTGAIPFVPPIENAEKFFNENVFVLSTLEEACAIKKVSEKSKRAVVVGASAIGSEMAAVFAAKGLEVTIVEFLGWVFPKMLDSDMGSLVSDYMKEKGIKIILNKGVSEIYGGEKAEGVIVENERIAADLIIIAAGVRPTTELAKKSGIELGNWGIKTDTHMRTSVLDVYAVGDCAEVFSLIDKKPTMMQLAISAYKQGLIAGLNATGAELEYKGALHTNVSVVGELEVASTGFSSEAAMRSGFKCFTAKASATTKPSHFPQTNPITVKLVAQEGTGKILGCQVVGGGGSWWRVNVVALAIAKNMSIFELSETELAYCPPVSDTFDVLLQACDIAKRRMRKR